MGGIVSFEGFSGLVAGCFAGAYLFHETVPNPYMDEVFHIPQAQRYCSGNLSYWDPMITTPPGLYFLSLLWATPLSYLLHVPTSDLCTSTLLRAQNVVCTLLLYIVVDKTLREGARSNGTAVRSYPWTALSLSTFPVLFFFSFLYYTDVGATLFVLLGHLFQIKGKHWCAAVVLLLSVCFRQTSVVWIVFVAGNEAMTFIHRYMHQKGRSLHLQDVLIAIVTTWPLQLFPVLLPYILVVLLFLGFIVANGSLALGDKTNHTLSFHLPQLFYFCVFSCFFASPRLFVDWWRIFVGGVKGVAKKPRRMVLVFFSLVILTVGVAVSVHFFTYAHPYLLADNRHYPFYVWKNIFKRHWMVKFLLAPIYMMAGAALVLPLLAQTRNFLWLLLFSVCCFTSLVPQRLLEFRYFIIPYLMFRIQLESGNCSHPRQHHLCSILEFLFYSLINVATIWLFLYKPFLWPDSQDLQRFMW